MKSLIVAAFAALCLMSPAATASTLEDIIGATKILYSSAGSQCSLQFVRSDEDGDYVVTANHCVDSKNAKVEYTFLDRQLNDEWKPISATEFWLKLVSQKAADYGDVAVLRLLDETHEFPIVDVCTIEEYEALSIGDDVTAVGFPVGMSHDLYISEGRFLGEAPAPGGETTAKGRWLKTSASVDGGSSGGALYMTDSEGAYCLLGTTSFKDPGTTAPMSYFSHPENLQTVLRGVLERPVVAVGANAEESVRDILNNK